MSGVGAGKRRVKSRVGFYQKICVDSTDTRPGLSQGLSYRNEAGEWMRKRGYRVRMILMSSVSFVESTTAEVGVAKVGRERTLLHVIGIRERQVS